MPAGRSRGTSTPFLYRPSVARPAPVWGSYCRGTDPGGYNGYPRGLRSLRPGFKSQHGRLTSCATVDPRWGRPYPSAWERT